MKAAIAYCIEHDILKEVLEAYASEVVNMAMTEWNWDDAKEVWQEEAREDGENRVLELVDKGYTSEQIKTMLSAGTKAVIVPLPEMETAMKAAIAYCIEHDILKKFLESHTSEVVDMLMTEWNWNSVKEVWEEEAREEGENRVLELVDKGYSSEQIKAMVSAGTMAMDVPAP
ncbi:hypothetical protein ACYULU_02415 [Breznakiellaceae bacterium SP9]